MGSRRRPGLQRLLQCSEQLRDVYKLKPSLQLLVAKVVIVAHVKEKLLPALSHLFGREFRIKVFVSVDGLVHFYERQPISFPKRIDRGRLWLSATIGYDQQIQQCIFVRQHPREPVFERTLGLTANKRSSVKVAGMQFIRARFVEVPTDSQPQSDDDYDGNKAKLTARTKQWTVS